jgi:hypothetical protein
MLLRPESPELRYYLQYASLKQADEKYGAMERNARR